MSGPLPSASYPMAPFRDALDHAITSGACSTAGRMLEGAIEEQGTLSTELRELVERHPRLLLCVAPSVAWGLQRAAPTTAGWRTLAASRDARGFLPAPELFGAELDAAIETLERAVVEQPRGPRRAVLAGWLTEVMGTNWQEGES